MTGWLRLLALPVLVAVGIVAVLGLAAWLQVPEWAIYPIVVALSAAGAVHVRGRCNHD